MKNTKTIPKLTFLTAILALLVSSASTLAHGPEDHIPPCEDEDICCTIENLDASWQDNLNLCDPNNPPNISQGIAISAGQGTSHIFPDGLCYPSFNNYIDMIDLDFPYGQAVEVGMDPYYSNDPPLFKDERNFFKARLRKEPAEWVDYKDDITIDVGDKVTFMIYMHNNGDPCLNDNALDLLNIPTNKTYKNWNTTSHGTKVKVEPEFSYNDEEKLSTIITSDTEFKASIWSQDARNAQGDIAPIENGVIIRPTEGKALELEYSEATAFYTDYDSNWNTDEHGINPSTLLRNGYSISTLTDSGNFKGGSGDFYACEPYIVVLVFTVEAKEVPEEEEPPPNTCSALEATDFDLQETVTFNNQTAYKLQTTDITFSPEDELPSGTIALWTAVDDENGQFIIYSTNLNTYITIGVGSATTADPYKPVYFLGNGTVTVELTGIPEEQANKEICTAEFIIPEEKPFCQYMTAQIEEADYNLEENSEYEHAYRLYVDNVVFSDGVIPPGTLVKWEANNESGEFFNQVGDLYPPYSITPKDYTYTELSTNPLNTIKSEVYYRGDEPVDITISIETPEYLGIDVSNCVFIIEIRPDQEELVCVDIQIDHPEEITVGTLSRFRAKAYDSQGNLYGDRIIYSVEPGYGRFYYAEAKPEDVPENDSPMVAEVTLDYSFIELTPQGTLPVGIFTQINPVYFSFTLFNGSFWDYNQVPNNQIIIPNYEDLTTNPLTPADYGQTQLLDIDFSTTYEIIVVGQGETVYFEALQPGTGVIHVQATGTDIPDECMRDFDIIEAPEAAVCQATDFIVMDTETEPEQVVTCLEDSTYAMNTTFYEDGAKTISIDNDRIKVRWTSTDTEGVFYDSAELLEGSGSPFLGKGNIIYVGGGTVSATLVELDGELYEGPLCAAQIVPCPPPELVCIDLDSIIIKYSDSEPVTTLSPNEIYILTASTTYDPIDYDEGTITYTIDPDYGTFIMVPEDPIHRLVILEALNALSNNDLTEASVAHFAGTLTSSVTTQNLITESVYLITYPATGGKNNILTIQATDRNEPECTETYDLEVRPCESIVVRITPEPFNPTADTLIWITEGDFGDFQGTFETEAFDKDGHQAAGEFYLLENEDNKFKTINLTLEQAADGFYYTGGEEGDTIEITAVGPLKGTNCNWTLTSEPEEIRCVELTIEQPEGTWTEDNFTSDNEQKFRIEVETDPAGLANQLTYHWDVDPIHAGIWEENPTNIDNSDNSPLINYLTEIVTEELNYVYVYAEDWEDECNDQLRFHKDEDEKQYPDIEKLIYYTEKERWASTVNLGGKDEDGDFFNSDYEFITYLAIYDSGSEQSVEIREDEIDNGEIKASNTPDGTFDYLGMVIAVKDENGDRYIVYKSEDSNEFDEDRYEDDKIEGEEISDFDDYNKDFDYFEDNYECENETEEFCIDHDFDYLEDTFMDGNKIEFKNLKEIDKIYIVYQMENNTAIDDRYCETMIEDIGECGEEFENKIRFEADMGDDELETGNDDTLAIVICPYILTREGGDVFFHSAIETGIDISACYEIEGSEEIIITPEPEIPETHIKTGIDDDEGTYLQLPTHDICKFSNQEDTTIEEYKNVLKNFSSAVCEMRAEVAEIWKEKYINEAIKANIEKIARFDVIQGGMKVSSMNEVSSQLGDNENGVFVIDGDLTVNGLSIEAFGNIPAAQTYIIKNGTLTINGNIKYNDASVTDITNPKTIPSVAFIVLDGNIEISNSVTQIDGILMAVDTEGIDDGDILSKEGKAEYGNTLTIRGSLIGDVSELFYYRRAIGDPLKDEGSVTIRYDERILLNTPPGLTELIDVSQLRIAE